MEQPKPLTPPEIQRQLADFVQRAKELDVREHYLTERELILQSAMLDLKTLDETIWAKKRQLSDVEKEVNERRQYLVEQEKLIENATDEGNATLRGIGYEIQAAQQRRDDLMSDLADIEMKCTNAAFRIVQIEAEVTAREEQIKRDL